MSPADLLALLLEGTAATSAAVLLVLGLRRPLRRRFGATAGYGLWWLVPAALVAVLLPASVAPQPLPGVSNLGAMTVAIASTATAPSLDYALWLSLLWAAGGVLFALRQGVQQRAFVRGLGRLQRRDDGLWQAASVAGLPAAFGLWRPRVVLPADFETRYTRAQRGLMCAHEHSHIARGDLHFNALVAALRCLFWFNPLLPVAARCFRHDQELACDQRVLARHPQSRRAYGEAMLNTQLAAQPLPAGCHWLVSDKGRSHPLKERIAMLKQPAPKFIRRLGGAALVTALTGLVGLAAWSGQPARAQPMQVQADQAASAIDRANPVYPAAAAENGVAGTVMLLVDVDDQGRVVDVEVEDSKPTGVFDQAAIDAVYQWRFQPRIENGRAAPGRVRVPIQFSPDNPVPGDDMQADTSTAETRLRPPAYPAAAVEHKISGRVVLVIDIDRAGNPTNVVVESSKPAGVFDQAAVDAAKQWKFDPRVEDGKPVAGRVRVPVDFKIPPGEVEGGGSPAGVATRTPGLSS